MSPRKGGSPQMWGNQVLNSDSLRAVENCFEFSCKIRYVSVSQRVDMVTN